MPEACYLKLFRSGELAKRAEALYEKLASCTLCPRECKVNRLEDKVGSCGLGRAIKVSSITSHFGEEPPITGRNGSGTIFFTKCNLHCKYCQNYDISQEGRGEEISEENLALKMLWLQSLGCHNINLVSPTHVTSQILKSLLLACEKGLRLPLVYNTGGYDSLAVLKTLDGIIDIYMPDIKYSVAEVGARLSQVKDYPDHNRRAIKEMFRQVGPLKMDGQGVAYRGLLVRHLVLPHDLAGSYDSLSFLANQVSKDIFLSLMAQYHPCYKACTDPELNRKITRQEYQRVMDWAEELGLQTGYFQALSSADIFLPDFKKENPFGQ